MAGWSGHLPGVELEWTVNCTESLAIQDEDGHFTGAELEWTVNWFEPSGYPGLKFMRYLNSLNILKISTFWANFNIWTDFNILNKFQHIEQTSTIEQISTHWTNFKHIEEYYIIVLGFFA